MNTVAVNLHGSFGKRVLRLGWLVSLLLGGAMAEDVPILRQNTFELGGFVGASYGVDKARVMGGGNLTYSAMRNILPYVEVSDFPSIQRTLPAQALGGTIHYDTPLADINFGIHARVRLPKTPIVPYGVVGFGLLHVFQSTQTSMTPNDSGGFDIGRKTLASSTDFAPNFGGGMRVYIKEAFGVRGEFKVYELTGGPLKDQLHYARLWRAAFGVFWQFGR